MKEVERRDHFLKCKDACMDFVLVFQAVQVYKIKDQDIIYVFWLLFFSNNISNNIEGFLVNFLINNGTVNEGKAFNIRLNLLEKYPSI